jgi:hypothetical protein
MEALGYMTWIAWGLGQLGTLALMFSVAYLLYKLGKLAHAWARQMEYCRWTGRR